MTDIVHIEDTLQIQEIVQQYFKIKGVEVLAAPTGREGLQLVLRSNPRLILLDHQLPDISGLEVSRWLRSNDITRQIPIIMLSVDDSVVVREEALQIGVNAFVPKPIDFALLDYEVEKLIGEFAKHPRPASPPDPIETPNIGQLYRQPPAVALPVLANTPREAWATVLEDTLVNGNPIERGLAVVALAAWQKEPDAPYNFLAGQRHFWHYVRHNLASIAAEDAGGLWGELAPVVRALIYPPDRIPEALALCMHSKRHEVRRWALRILLENQDSRVGELAVDALDDPKDGVRAMAALVLGHLQDSAYVPVLTRTLNDPSNGVREQAGAALASIGSEMAVMALGVVLLEGSSDAAEVAANALAQIGTDESAELLVEAAQERQESPVLRQLAHALGKLKHYPRCKILLLKLTRHEDESVRQTARSYTLLG
ncbi:MAG: response regulator [Anaerolineaceae bacterium]|nr:response regulator [Anaerolineaceae bacterium]